MLFGMTSVFALSLSTATQQKWGRRLFWAGPHVSCTKNFSNDAQSLSILFPTAVV